MLDLSGNSTFVVGLGVDEDGDLRLALSGGILEIRFAADDEPLALCEVRITEAEAAELGPWQASGGLG
jgi:hypothetical protein